MKIDVAAQLGPLCISADDGEVLRETLVQGLEAGESIDLNFAGVEVFASPFLNAAVGSLLRDYSKDTLNAKVRFVGLTPEHADLLRRVIANARDYFANPKVKQIVDDAVEGDPRAKA